MGLVVVAKVLSGVIASLCSSFSRQAIEAKPSMQTSPDLLSALTGNFSANATQKVEKQLRDGEDYAIQ